MSERPPPEMVGLELLEALELRVGKIVEARRVDETRKVLKLQVDLGDQRRQVIADLAQFYDPEELIGRQVIVIVNLKPAVVHGHRSHGKLLIVEGQGQIHTFARPDRSTTLGARAR